MTRFDRWIIERRDLGGQLVFGNPQPEHHFGGGAITGMSENEVADAVFRAIPDAIMTGDNIPRWPALIHPQFVARRKTW